MKKREKIIEILGLETDKNGKENMFIIRNARRKLLYGIDFTKEVDELEKLISIAGI